MPLPKTKKEMKEQANNDAALKIALEQPFARQLRRLFREVGYAFAGQYLRDSTIIDLNAYRSDFIGILKENYRKVANKFGYRLIKEVDIVKQEPTEKDKASMLVDAAIADFINELVPREADLIIETTQKNLEKDVEQVQTEAALAGIALSAASTAELARKKFNENSIERSDTIAETETQTMSEKAKSIEMGTLVSVGATLAGIRLREVIVKTWITILDNRTRQAHARADGQQVRVEDKFFVGGEFLEQPGDPSARPENRIYCRCSMIISPKP